jgi:hypothetical protein
LEQLGFWRKLLEHPATIRSGAIRRWTRCRIPPARRSHDARAQPRDQEDIWRTLRLQGARAEGHSERQVFLVMGPWHHGQSEGSQLRALKFNSDTALYFRERSCVRSSTSTPKTM